ncbi:MAG: hypothetical protein MRZ90_00885 [Candidatus Gastranaerophilales bacterium]|nr:hypothetical protein [Candidatus Gastranaerophilales bacterium]
MGIQSIQNNQGVNLLQYLNAKNAFQDINTEKKNNDDDINLNKKVENTFDDKNMVSKINTQEVKNYATQMNETLTDDDIKYGLVYGRSVIADYIA